MYDSDQIGTAMKIKLDDRWYEKSEFAAGVRRAPARDFTLTQAQTEIALKNALRYIPHKYHRKLAPELLEELLTRGRIYGYRYRPPALSRPGRSISTKGGAWKAEPSRS